jgi:hypothetical protein
MGIRTFSWINFPWEETEVTLKRRRNKLENLRNRNLSLPNGEETSPAFVQLMVGIGRVRGWPTGTLLLPTLNCRQNAKPRQSVGGELASEHRRLMNWLCLLVLLVETHMGDLEVGAPSKKKKKKSKF